MKKCSRCKVCYYCSSKCQKSDWKGGHKNKCIQASIVAESIGIWLTLDLTNGFRPGLPYMSINSTNFHSKPILMGINEYENAIIYMLNKYSNGKQFVIKAQLGMDKVTRKLIYGTPCQIYDKNRKMLCFARPDITEEKEYHLLFDAIAKTTHGSKGYFSAMIMKEKDSGRKVLKVRIDKELFATNVNW